MESSGGSTARRCSNDARASETGVSRRRASGAAWACTTGGLTELGPDLVAARHVDLPLERPWSAATDDGGRIWVVGDVNGVALWDGLGVRPVPLETARTLRAVSPMPRGAAIATARSVTTSADGRVVAVGRDFGQVDLLIAAQP